jgi:hypothetical protein
MKITSTALLLMVQFLSPRITTTSAEPSAAETECGDLGVMRIDTSKLPRGVDLSKMRKCREHPSALLDKRDIVTKRACLEKKEGSYGCSKDRYCWSACGSGGKWCWMAYDGGIGGWMTCSTGNHEHCNPNMVKNSHADCGKGEDCNACGCDCRDKR